jgi:hypothetical protein
VVLLVLVAGLVAALLCQRIFGGDFDMFEPITPMAIALGVMFVIRPVLLLMNDQLVHIGYDIEPTFDGALLVGAVGTAGFAAGYFVRDRRATFAVSESGKSPSTSLLLSYAAVLAVLGYGLYGAFIVQAGGSGALASFIAGRESSQDAVFRSTTGYLYQGLLLTLPSALILFAVARTRDRPGLYALGLAILLPVLVLGGAQGSRLNLLVTLSAPVVFLYLYGRRRPGVATLIVASYLILTIGLGFLANARYAESRDDPRESILVASLLDPLGQLQGVLLGPDTEMFDTLANELSVVPEALPFQHGAIVADILVRAIPRPLWPEKPLESADQLIDTLWPAHFAVSRASPATSVLGSLYQDSGLVTVFLGMAVVGLLLRGLWRWAQRRADDISVLLVYSSVWPLTIVLARGNIVHTLAIGFFTLLPLLPLLLVSRDARPALEH